MPTLVKPGNWSNHVRFDQFPCPVRPVSLHSSEIGWLSQARLQRQGCSGKVAAVHGHNWATNQPCSLIRRVARPRRTAPAPEGRRDRAACRRRARRCARRLRIGHIRLRATLFNRVQVEAAVHSANCVLTGIHNRLPAQGAPLDTWSRAYRT